EAWEILAEHRDVLDDLVLELMDKETLPKDDLARIFAPVGKRPSHNTFTGFGKRSPSDKPPVMTPSELFGAGRGGPNGSSGSPAPLPTPGGGVPMPSPFPPAPAGSPHQSDTEPAGYPSQPAGWQPGDAWQPPGGAGGRG